MNSLNQVIKIKTLLYNDDFNLKSDYWEMIYVDKLFPRDSHRSQRNLKIRPHLYSKILNILIYR